MDEIVCKTTLNPWPVCSKVVLIVNITLHYVKPVNPVSLNGRFTESVYNRTEMHVIDMEVI